MTKTMRGLGFRVKGLGFREAAHQPRVPEERHGVAGRGGVGVNHAVHSSHVVPSRCQLEHLPEVHHKGPRDGRRVDPTALAVLHLADPRPTGLHAGHQTHRARSHWARSHWVRSQGCRYPFAAPPPAGCGWDQWAHKGVWKGVWKGV
eukprot:385170-Pyramimonas_sp.AAC.1